MADGDGARPMTEAEWERRFRESDLRAARYGDLFETLIDDPNRDEIVAREMGWLPEEGDVEPADDAEAFGEIDDEDAFDLLNAEPDDETVEALRREDEELERMPAYRLAYDAANEVWEALRPYSASHAEGSDAAEAFGEAIGNAMIPAAKIAGGHGMGYDDDVLCGNIVCNTRALDAAKETLGALQRLGAAGLVPAEVADALTRREGEVVAAIELRIAELRSRVWW